ncbi:MAG: MraY family glycosyltransferase [Bryobacteraceae bacterium]|jgi:UDP-GlcNAc:undecaprenyl-phosphate GlcNAc-1-phosphate transferase
MYYSLAIVFLCALALSSILTPICRSAALRMNLVDRPDGARKLHRRPVPRIGGIPILSSIAAACGCLAFLPWAGTKAVAGALSLHWPFLAVLAVVFAIGFADDIVGLGPRQKLVGLVAAAGLAFACGIRINSVGALHLPIWLSAPITILWLVGCATAFNLIDGLDGLATGVALLATLGMLVSASLVGLGSNYLLALALVPMAGALLGFLPYNFNPASIFLGDSGSLMIGFLLGSSSVLLSQKSTTLLGMTAPIMVLTIPLLDVILSIARRFLRGKPIFCADRGHIHHRLLDLGFPPGHAALLLYGACLLAAAFSLALTVAPDRIGGWVIVLFCTASFLGIQSLGYAEFALAGRLMLSGTFQHSLNAHLNLRAVENSLRAAESADECWTALCEACRIFGFTEARYRVADQVLHKQFGSQGDDEGWNIRIPLPGGDYINFTRPQDSTVLAMGVAPLLDMVSKVMAEKCLASSEFVSTLSAVAPIYEIENHRRRAVE